MIVVAIYQIYTQSNRHLKRYYSPISALNICAGYLNRTDYHIGKSQSITLTVKWWTLIVKWRVCGLKPHLDTQIRLQIMSIWIFRVCEECVILSKEHDFDYFRLLFSRLRARKGEKFQLKSIHTATHCEDYTCFHLIFIHFYHFFRI